MTDESTGQVDRRDPSGGSGEHAGRAPNRLIHETSPYLLQHAFNPVGWYPWGSEALATARRDDKPILLSIGYSACHWCHVMEREFFEDEAIAQLMNDLYVPVKVDREERPDLDAIYMEAVTALTRHGGWPMTVFLLPDGTPFYGGTYFPPTARHGMPSFRDVLTGVADAYRNRRGDVDGTADQLRALLQRQPSLAAGDRATPPSSTVLEQAERTFASSFDAAHGGFGRAPKFPQPMGIEALLRAWLRSRNPQTLRMAQVTLDKMAQGGMYDQLGGGFHRYSVDEKWLVPHFEKMLYDNALLSRTYLHAYLATGNALYRRVCEQTLDYVLREMTSPEGGFYSTQDADSEGEEGRFFLWTPIEVKQLLGDDDGRLCCEYFDVTERGNFEGRNILHIPRYADVVAHVNGVSEARLMEAVERGRRILFEAREQRIKPGRDDKIITAWNGLLLRSLAEAAAAFDRDDYRRAAAKNAEFVLTKLAVDAGDRAGVPTSAGVAHGGTRSQKQPVPEDVTVTPPLRLLRTYKDGQAKLNAYLEDYACLAAGLLALYEATFDLRWFEAATRLAAAIVAHFADDAGGGFFDTSADHEALLTRPEDLYDNATPSGNSVAVDVLLRLSEFSGNDDYRERAERVLGGLRDAMAQHPTAFGYLLCALDFSLGPVKEVALTGTRDDKDVRALVRAVFERYQPNKVVALRQSNGDGSRAEAAIPLLAGRTQLDGKATAYVCERFTCQLPSTDPAVLAGQIGGVAAGSPAQ